MAVNKCSQCQSRHRADSRKYIYCSPPRRGEDKAYVAPEQGRASPLTTAWRIHAQVRPRQDRILWAIFCWNGCRNNHRIDTSISVHISIVSTYAATHGRIDTYRSFHCTLPVEFWIFGVIILSVLALYCRHLPTPISSHPIRSDPILLHPSQIGMENVVSSQGSGGAAVYRTYFSSDVHAVFIALIAGSWWSLPQT